MFEIRAWGWGDVSIHAPARGATLCLRSGPGAGVMFQSTPPHGGRLIIQLFFLLIALFQSTPPHGGRLNNAFTSWTTGWFQSTPPHGGRQYLLLPWVYPCNVSIHAPARGGDYGIDAIRYKGSVSIHAPARGGD